MHRDSERIRELYEYKIFDTPPEKELDELAEIASLIFEVPISLVTVLDDKRQFFKSKMGVDFAETTRENSICTHAIDDPKNVFVVEDLKKDERFIDHVLVRQNPNFRFYAGAPLETPNGNVLGTLCVIDKKPRKINQNQLNALQLLAKKAMDYLNTRKLLLEQKSEIDKNLDELKKLTDNIPGAIFQFKMNSEYELDFQFISKGISKLYPSLTQEMIRKSRRDLYELVHKGDLAEFQEVLKDSFINLNVLEHEYRVKLNGNYRWHLLKAQPEREENGEVIWYGHVQDIHTHIEYENTLQQISFDISHVLRRPVTSLLGLAKLIEREENLNEENLKLYAELIQTVSSELDDFTKQLHKSYHKKNKDFFVDKN
ncbi:GAF domain-containing protein [Mesonia maritima]|uniref:PAS domain-containing protein n=1 Tax=Mesonia maritima TaxID=1793873 RepID=A0ABU1K629_9FLAO|nr:GAF domain-containing protein [Mesonia maritima]MDR6301065.1 hypothetical protein [Mesonia maritima]